jgi:hypothetical protein
MKWIYSSIIAVLFAAGALFWTLKKGDAEIRAFCDQLPLKLSSAEVRSLASAAGLESQQLPHSEMRVTKAVPGRLFPRATSCRIVLNRELTVEFRMLEGP